MKINRNEIDERFSLLVSARYFLCALQGILSWVSRFTRNLSIVRLCASFTECALVSKRATERTIEKSRMSVLPSFACSKVHITSGSATHRSADQSPSITPGVFNKCVLESTARSERRRAVTAACPITSSASEAPRANRVNPENAEVGSSVARRGRH